MLNYKKSDGILLSSDNKTMIVDIGNGYSGVYNEGLWDARSLKATEIEVVMLTHLHNSHPSTLNSLFENNMVRTLLVPRDDNSSYYKVLETAKNHGVDTVIYSLGDSIVFEDAVIKTFPHRYIDRSTQPMIRLDIGAFGDSFTYLGGAYFDSYPEPMLSDNTDAVWFGTHGPLYKNEFSPLLPDGCEVFADESASSFIDTDISPSAPYAIIFEE